MSGCDSVVTNSVDKTLDKVDSIYCSILGLSQFDCWLHCFCSSGHRQVKACEWGWLMSLFWWTGNKQYSKCLRSRQTTKNKIYLVVPVHSLNREMSWIFTIYEIKIFSLFFFSISPALWQLHVSASFRLDTLSFNVFDDLYSLRERPSFE